jgi:hypothetical protein
MGIMWRTLSLMAFIVWGGGMSLGSKGDAALAQDWTLTSLSHADLRFSGRRPSLDKFELLWPGASVSFKTHSRNVRLGLDNQGPNYLEVRLRDEAGRELSRQTLALKNGEQTVTLTAGAGSGAVEYLVFRRTEGMHGPIELTGLELAAPADILPLPERSLQIEFFGDSITVGASNEDPGADQWGDFATHNHYLSYAAITARQLQADFRTIAESGMGLVDSWNNQPTLADLWNQTRPTRDAQLWDFSRWQPDIVVLNIGQNDHSLGVGVEFQTAYQKLVNNLRQVYPRAFILCTLGGMSAGQDQVFKGYIKEAVSKLQEQGLRRLDWYFFEAFEWQHPRVPTHRQLADELETKIRSLRAAAKI